MVRGCPARMSRRAAVARPFAINPQYILVMVDRVAAERVPIALAQGDLSAAVDWMSQVKQYGAALCAVSRGVARLRGDAHRPTSLGVKIDQREAVDNDHVAVVQAALGEK